MEYPIFSMRGEPCFDSLGVIKLRCERSVAVDDRIFAQAQIGRTAELLFARVWSFEPAPTPKAVVKVQLFHGGHSLVMSADAGGEGALLLDGVAVEDKLTAYQISGEDLQGEYWGAVLMIPFSWLTEVLILPTDFPAVIEGNILREHPACSSAVPVNETVRFLLS